MLLPGRIYIALGPWHFGDFCNIFLPNIEEDQRKSYDLSAGPLAQRWNRSGFSRPDPTGKFQNHRRSTGRSTDFFTEGFFHCSMYLMKIFRKGEGMGEELKFVTSDGGLRKKGKKTFAFFAKNDSILRPFLVKFRFE